MKTGKKFLVAVAMMLVPLAGCSGRDPRIPVDAQDVTLSSIGGPQTPPAMSDTPYFYTGFRDPARLVIRDNDAWLSAWSTLVQPYEASASAPPPPLIDFSTDMVVLAAMGERRSGGYTVEMKAAATQEQLYVSVTQTDPGMSCAVSLLLTQPVAVARLQRFDGPVTFVESQATCDCQ